MTARQTPRARLRASLLPSLAAMVATGLTSVVAATPANAIGERGDAGGHLGWVAVVLIFVGIPLAVGAVVSLLVYLPSIVRGPRYRPGRPWTSGSVWFGGPADADAALASVTSLPAATVEGGGASASW